MTPTSRASVVIDASAMVALLTDAGPAGEWATAQALAARLAAPSLMPYEVANILRRQVLTGTLDASVASLAHTDLAAMAIDLCPYDALAERAWMLRDNLTIYDAAYVALAEMLGVPLITLDARLARAFGPRCSIVAYGEPASVG